MVAGVIGLPKIGLIDGVSLGRVGWSAVSAAPAVRGPGGFTGTPRVNNYITIQGRVLSDMELGKTIDKHTKDRIKRHGLASLRKDNIQNSRTASAVK
jgi:hypothetical protein